MKKLLQQIILHFTIVLMLLIASLNAVIANNRQGGLDEALQKKVNKWMDQSGLSFEENKGQFADDKGNPVPDLLFKTNAKGMDMYITTSGITYLFTKRTKVKVGKSVEKETENHEEMHRRVQQSRVDMILSGATIKKENITMEYPLEQGTLNYYLGHCPEGILGVQTYRKVTIKGIYAGIDWVLYTQGNEGLKYDFIVHPGADPKRIKMCYKGAETLEKLDDETLKITTRLGEIKEGKLVSYEEESLKEVKSSYQIHRTTSNSIAVSFDVGSYDLSQRLVIDPPLLWATYYGGTGGDGPHEIATDALGNIYITGYTGNFGISTLPLDSLEGAYYQDSIVGISGTTDTYILKFNSSGVRQWATLYGGTINDYGNGIAIDNMGNIYMMGGTGSSDFPLRDPGGSAYFRDTQETTEAFIIKFNASGVRIWATFYGGNSYEDLAPTGQRIAIDSFGNVYITGGTKSNNLPMQDPGGGAYIQSYNGVNDFDVFIAKFDSAMNLVWSTYYGGLTGNEYGTAITSDNFGNVYITGYTTSADFPVYNTSNAYSQAFGGIGLSDAFILKFNSSGDRLWAAYYGGSVADFGRDITTDVSGNVYVTGETISADFPTYRAGIGSYFQPIGSGGGNPDAFILKFDSAGVRKWATYYGGLLGYELAYSITTDISGNLYSTGYTESNDFPLQDAGECNYFNDVRTTGLPTTIYILQFDTSGVRKWATFYAKGWGAGIATDRSGNIYVTGEVLDNEMDVLNPGGGAYFQSQFRGNHDGFILKFASPLNDPYTVSFTANPKQGCAPLCVSFNNTTANTDIANWKFGDGQTGSGSVVSHCYTEAGNYNITLDITDNYGCSETITVQDLIQVFPNPVADFYMTPPQGNSLRNALIRFTDESKGANHWLWNFGDPMNSQSSLQNPSFTYNHPGYYTVMLLVTNSEDCTDTISHIMYIEPEFTIYVPNAFTPDNDGLNDSFAPQGMEFTEFEMALFNRWGEEIYQTTEIDKPWNGKSKNGEEAQEGVYVYKIWVKDFKDKIHYYVGNVTLIK